MSFRANPRLCVTLAVLWIGAGLAAPFVPMLTGLFAWPVDATGLFALQLLAVSAIGINIIMEFVLGRSGEAVRFSPCFGALVVGMVLLPVPLAMLLGYCLLFDIDKSRWELAWWNPFASAGKWTLALGAGGLVAHLITGPTVSGAELVLAATAAAFVFTVVDILSYVVWYQVADGSGLGIVGNYWRIALIDILIAVVAVSIAGPFHGIPLVTALVLLGLQIAGKALSSMSTSENLNRLRNEHLRDVFGRMVPAHLADQIADSGEEIQLGGEGREISVLFADIRGFTSWSENVEPEEVITQLNALLRGLSGAVMECNGTLDKYTGDGLMAFWGAPLDQPDHARLACNAAMDMLGKLDECNAARAADGLPPFAIGIGVHSGPAVVGNIGHEDRLDYTAIGDTVNLSARLEAATKETGSVILISSTTLEALPNRHQRLCTSVGSIRVKGRVQPVEVYSMVGSEGYHDAAHAWLRAEQRTTSSAEFAA
jgi:class 3 adenylate cyclase